MSAEDELLEASLREVLDRVADESPSPASSAAAATSVALAAGLAAMAARRSRTSWPDAPAAAGQAAALQDRAAELIPETAEAYEIAVGRLARDDDGEDRPEQRDWKLGTALERAGDVPLAFAEIAADVGELCAEVAEHGDPAHRADAVAGCLLAEAGARVAVHLVEVNLVTGEDDERLSRAASIQAHAERSRERALALQS